MKSMRVRIKMCGTTNVEDARAAVAFGVDALGFIFVPQSPRHVTDEQAGQIIRSLPPFVSRVGVFVDSSLALIKQAVESCGLTQVQLHGHETPELCADLRGWCAGLQVCKAFRVGKHGDDFELERYRQVVDCLLLDTYEKGRAGGTGNSFDWRLVENYKIGKPIIIAGGLTPDNIEAAIRQVRPYAVDINSGVEKRPGVKDHNLLRQLIKNVRLIEQESDFEA